MFNYCLWSSLKFQTRFWNGARVDANIYHHLNNNEQQIFLRNWSFHVQTKQIENFNFKEILILSIKRVIQKDKYEDNCYWSLLRICFARFWEAEHFDLTKGERLPSNRRLTFVERRWAVWTYFVRVSFLSLSSWFNTKLIGRVSCVFLLWIISHRVSIQKAF